MKFLQKHPLLSILVFIFTAGVLGSYLYSVGARKNYESTVLTAGKNGMYLFFYADGAFELGVDVLIHKRIAYGKYHVSLDTLKVDSATLLTMIPRGYFLVDGKVLDGGHYRFDIKKNVLVPDSVANRPKTTSVPAHSHYKYVLRDLRDYRKKFGRYPGSFEDLVKMDGVDWAYYRDALHFNYQVMDGGKSFRVNGLDEKGLEAAENPTYINPKDSLHRQ